MIGILAGCTSQPIDTSLHDAAPTVRAHSETADATAQAWEPARLEYRTVTINGSKRDYLVSLPPGARQRKGLPLILGFHGYTGSAEHMQQRSGLSDADAVVAYLQGVDAAWSPAPYAKTSVEDDLSFSDHVREQLIAEFHLHPARVFAAGFSNGGGFAGVLGCRRPQQFTAIATVAAAYYDSVTDGCSPIPMKRIDIHGTSDAIIQYQGGSRHGSHYESVYDFLDESRIRNRCEAEPLETQATAFATALTWMDCDAGLKHIRVQGGEHVWPGSDARQKLPDASLSATDEILSFFGVDKY